MPLSPTLAERTGTPDPAPQPSAVLHELAAVLESAPFRTSRQCQRLLRYIVEQTLAGHADALRERIIGMEVFERRADYDPGQDPVVRIRAADVRKRLAQYYQSAEVSAEAVLIDVPSGSYRASFRLPITAPVTEAPVASIHRVGTAVEEIAASTGAGLQPISAEMPIPPTSVPRSRRRVGIAVSMAVLFLACLAVIGALRFSPGRSVRASGLDQFWAPLLGSTQPVLLCLGTNAVYRLSDSYMAAYRREHHIADNGAELFASFARGSSVSASDLVPVTNTFVSESDVIAATDVATLLSQHRKPFGQRISGDLSFSDLRHVPSILVGGFNNRWTLEMTGDLRFHLAGGTSIVDSQTNRRWSIQRDRAGNATDDYALISRLTDGKTGAPLFVVAGIGAYGTQAAGEFVSSPAALARLARSAPQGWAQRNMQILLHVRVVEYAPSKTDVIAERFW